MKKKIICIASIAVAVVLVAVLAFQLIFNTKIVIHNAIDRAQYASSSDENWDVKTEGTVVLENDNILMELDAVTTHFVITDKISGNQYYSVPLNSAEAADEDNADIILSELSIKYYDSQFVEGMLYSFKNSVDFGLTEVKTDGNAIRVYYTLRKTQIKTFAPVVIDQETYENEICTKISNSLKRRLGMYYTLYLAEDTDAETMEMKSKYPALETHNLYIIRGKVDETGYTEITKALTAGEYSEERYLEDCKKFGINASAAGVSVGFTIPVEYTVNEDGFSAKVLYDKFVSESTVHKAVNVELLPYFASAGKGEGEYIFVPDGSGGIINIDEKAGKVFEKVVYGSNGSIKFQNSQQLVQNITLPVFGLNRGDSGYVAVIDGAAEEAYINAKVYGGTNLQSTVYARFNVYNVETTSIGAYSGITTYYLYSKNMIAVHPSVRYILLNEDNCDYSGMANQYRDYLIDSGVLTNRLEATENVPMYVDFTGYFTSSASIMGVPYSKKNVISTLSGATNAVNKLAELGVDNINVRLKAYGNNGMYQTVADKFDLTSSVGSVEQLKNLASVINSNGGLLYLENSIGVVYSDGAFDSFVRNTHSSRLLTKLMSINGSADIITKGTRSMNYNHYLVSPWYFNSLSQNFVDSFTKAVGSTEGFGFSWGQYGSKIWSDFREKKELDRTLSSQFASEAFNTSANNFASSMTDGGNAYAISNSDVILNIATSDSLYDSISYSVPFYAMVVHGYKDYSSAPFNLAADTAKNRLASIESGANVYYSCYTESDEVIKNLFERSKQYPTGITGIYNDIAKTYNEFNSIFADLRTQIIVRHDMLEDDVFCTTYEDGTKIIVNYNSYDVVIDDAVVSAGGYIVK